jgi:hypothetical protein
MTRLVILSPKTENLSNPIPSGSGKRIFGIKDVPFIANFSLAAYAGALTDATGPALGSNESNRLRSIFGGSIFQNAAACFCLTRLSFEHIRHFGERSSFNFIINVRVVSGNRGVLENHTENFEGVIDR